MREDLLHQIWNENQFNGTKLMSIDHQEVEIIRSGTLNTNSGPDFLNAIIRVNGIIWHGHIEFHLKSSDWNKHKHLNDAAYDNVILHLVYECDTPVFTKSGVELLQVEVKSIFDFTQIKPKRNHELICHHQIKSCPELHFKKQLERTFFERLEEKTKVIVDWQNKYHNDWEQIAHLSISRAFGTNINQHAFERLAEVVPIKKIQRWSKDQVAIEAILFLYSGLLQTNIDHYSMFLEEKAKQFHLANTAMPMNPVEWKFNRMRPSNFPSIRISQLASLFSREKNLFSKILEAENLDELMDLFRCEASEYWDNHFHFYHPSTSVRMKKTSDAFIHSLVINACVPLVFVYGKYIHDERLCEKAIMWMEQLPAENNHYTKAFENAGKGPVNAFESQAMIQQYRNFCQTKKCLSCSIGQKCIKNEQNCRSLSIAD